MAVKVMVQELCVAVVFELCEGVLTGNSDVGRWVNEVTRPPDDASFHAPKTYSGWLFVVRNEIRRSLLLDHRTPAMWRSRQRSERYDDLHDFD